MKSVKQLAIFIKRESSLHGLRLIYAIYILSDLLLESQFFCTINVK